MEVLYILIPIAILLLLLIVFGLFWAIRSGQFDDMEGPAHEVLLDDDRIRPAQSSEIDPVDDDGPQSKP